MTHYAVIRSSGRTIPVTVCGRVMFHEAALTPHDAALRALGLPYGHHRVFSRKDRRFLLLPRDWAPEDNNNRSSTTRRTDDGARPDGSTATPAP